MPLLATTQLVNARIAELGQKIAAHLTAAANAVNQQAQTVMSLSDADLAEWLNEQCEEAETLFAAHAALGAAINGASHVVVTTLAASNISAPSASVDVRPVPEKLAEHRREIITTDGVFAVVTHPAPKPEPATEEPQP